MKTHYQVIVVGAGPSGLATALNLRQQGVDDILVLEKKTFPRYKCCAGYITNKTKTAYEQFGLDIGACHYTLIKDFNIFYQLRGVQTIPNRFLYTNRKIDRVELDHSFFLLSKMRGIAVWEDTYIECHEPDKNQVLLNQERTVTYEYLVFADGTTGFGSRYQPEKRRNIAMQVTFPADRRDAIGIHFGITPKGYAWVSSYQGITNVGLTDVYTPGRDYRAVFANFLDRLELSCDLRELRAAFTPIGTGLPVMDQNVFFVGDAVGACDPLTLSGLRYSLKSGEKCAQSIRTGNPGRYRRYIRTLGIRFKMMTVLQRLFYRKPILWLTFNVGCRYFSGLMAFAFNHFFVNKK